MKCNCGKKLDELKFRLSFHAKKLAHVGLECKSCRKIIVDLPSDKKGKEGVYSDVYARYIRS